MLRGFAIGGYRSFGGNVQLIGPFEKINLFIGSNNSGKSNVLKFLHEHYKLLIDYAFNWGNGPKFSPLDRHVSSGPIPLVVGLVASIPAICQKLGIKTTQGQLANKL